MRMLRWIVRTRSGSAIRHHSRERRRIIHVRCLSSRLGSLGGGREGVVDGLGVPTGEIEVFVCAGHVGEQLGFRHVTGTSAEGDLGRRLSGDEDELAVARGARRRRAGDDG